MPADEPKTSEPKKPPGIFISYRRSDNPDAVGRIYDRLVNEFGKSRVFKDVDSIPLGQDFRGHLNDIVGGCAAVLAIIGPRWTDTRNAAGQRRLEDPDDFVRIELEAALERNVAVVPVLVGHATMPALEQLPASLASLVYRQAIDVRPDPDFHGDATRLVVALRHILDPNAPLIAAKPLRPVKWMAAFAAAMLVAAALAIPALKHLRAPLPPEWRTDIVTPASDLPLHFALSPDGQQIVFVAKDEGATRLWLRPLATATAQPIPGTEGASAPFWSPDGQSIGFFAAGSLLRVGLRGGQPQVLAPVRRDGDLGGAWSPAGNILFGEGQTDALRMVADTGGRVTDVVTPNPDRAWLAAPRFLPDGRRFLFVARAGSSPGIYLGNVDGVAPVQLTAEIDPLVTPVAYHSPGWVLWSRGRALTAQRLDLRKSALAGQRLTLANGVDAISASAGLVAYRTGAAPKRQLAWVDRSGAAQDIADPDHSLSAPRVAADGRVVVSRETQGNVDLWLLDGARSSRMTFGASPDGMPVWSPDGASIAYSSAREVGVDLFVKASSGAGAEELLVANVRPQYASSWSADGRFLLYFSIEPDSGANIHVLPMTGERKPFAFLATPAFEVWGQFSPDGKWVAYQSSQSGQAEIYVRPFVAPDAAGTAPVAGGQWQVSTQGGIHPAWRPDGSELYFLSPAGQMMAAPVAVSGSVFVPSAPVPLFDARIVGGGQDRAQGRQYDVAPDGRFLVNRELDTGTLPPITLIQNWNPARKD